MVGEARTGVGTGVDGLEADSVEELADVEGGEVGGAVLLEVGIELELVGDEGEVAIHVVGGGAVGVSELDSELVVLLRGDGCDVVERHHEHPREEVDSVSHEIIEGEG